MQANELRIGNWVRQRESDTYIQIEQYLLCNEELCHYQPIPLTEEWLLKFGFEIKLDNFNWNAGIGINEIGDFKLALRYTYDFGWFYKSRCTPIKYVHQLQNLYWVLCSEELTDALNDKAKGELLMKVATKLTDNQKSIPHDFNQIITENFNDLI
jgi:hypothetical protein